ncbi:MAG: hypothetical protein RBT74_17590, partial [Tenuifilaceae bacterium]|nr:hypothetical protein [Tenuifilaceae bacterium]
MIELGALSNKAWDITSDMADGTFEYELTLPVVENVDESKIQLVYVEEKEDLNDENKIKAVEKEDVKVDNDKNELVANGLDHFTVYLLKKEASKESDIVSTMGLTNGGCILDVTDDYSDLNCTANDIELAGPNAIVKDSCDYPGDTANFDLYVDVNNNASERYDVGIWISTDGDPNHDGSYSGMCSVANLPTLDPGFDLDFDACGDVEATSSTPDINNAFIGNITLPCSDVDQDGQLDVPIVTSWSNSSKDICNLPQDTIPETKAKCKTKLDFNIPVPVPGQIIIKKETTPNASIQEFNFNLVGNSNGNFDGSEDFSLSDGEAWDSGLVIAGGLMAGVYNVAESLLNNWDLTNVTCSSSRGTSTFNPILNGRQINLTAGDTVTCTFTNTQQSGHIIVDKITDPSGDPQIFNFDASGGAYADFSLTDTAAPNDQTLIAGIYSVAETVPAGWALTSATCSDGSDPSSISLQAGETVTCTFTNTKLNPVINVEKSSTTTTIITAGQVVPYTFAVTNVGNQILTGITVVDPMCDAAPSYVSGDTNSDSKLDLNETWTYACSHTVTQVEIDGGGNLSNTVTADSNESDYDTDSLNIPIAQNATLTVEKSSATTILSAPATVTYSYLVTNTGNVTLTGISLSDDNDNDDMNCLGVTTLAPASTMTCTATHTFTQGELDAGGSLDNIVTASSNEASDATDYLSIPISQYPGINITKVADVSSVDAVGDVINYTIEVENTGNQTLTGVFVSDPLIANLDCDETPGVPFVTTGLVINVDDTLTCTGTYAVTQFDIDNNGGGDGDIDNTATADSNQTDQDTASEAVDIIQIKSMTVEKSSATTILSAPATVTYSYLVTNTGNVTLTGISLSDDNDNDDMNCPFSTLAPGVKMTCTATHTFTQGELDAGGSLDNIVTASSNEASDATDNLSIPISQDPGINITKDADQSSVNAAGNIITYTINVQNIGNTTLTGVSVNDPLLANLDCDAAEGLQAAGFIIAIGGTLTCTGTYAVTQSDIDNNGGGDGDIDNTATADSNQTEEDAASETVLIVRNPLINIEKSSTTISIITAGQVVPYTFVVTNVGNTTLNNVVVTDPKCDATPAYQGGDDGDGKLQINEIWNYSCNHTVTQDEINAGGNLYNMATADSDESDPDTDDFNIPISQLPALTIDKTATPTNYDSVGDVISYSYLVTNSGNVTLYNISVVDDKATVTCPDTSAGLAPLGQITCTASYIITQGDLDGGVVTNVAYATDGKTDSLIDTETVNAEQDPLLSIVKSGTFVDGNADGYADVGETITYTFTVKNEGNMTLTNVTVTDPKVTVNGGPTTLDVGETDATTFTATYTITQADIDAGKVDNTATADSNESGPANDDETVNLSQNPALTIEKTATPTTYDSVGDVISYSYLVTNSGNVTLYNLFVVDDKATVTCPDTSAGLTPSGQITCTASYVITQADLDGGSVTNNAYATDGKTDSLIDTETVNSVAGKIIIEKQTLPNGDLQSFEFDSSWSETNFSLTDGQQNISGWLAPGPYSIAEIVPSGWDLTDAVCTAASDPTHSFDPRANGFILSDGDTITCVFTNTKRGLITVAKDAINNDAQDFEFTNNFSNDNPATFYLDDDSNGALPKLRTFEVLPGEYWVSEEAVAGWQQESATCDNGDTIDSINVEPGENITCEFVNEKYAKIILVKNTIGGDDTFDFDAMGDGLPVDIDLTTANGTASQAFENLDQDNTYSIAENVPTNWNLTSAICTGDGNTPDKITPEPGETVTCTFTNTKKSNLTVVKKVINDNGGIKTVDDFGINFSGGALNFDAGVSLGSTTTYTSQTLTVNPGSHNLFENDVFGYTEGVWDCGAVGAGGISTVVSLAPGENKTCTIINDDVAPTITLNKNVTGGIAGVNEFGLTIGDVAVDSGVKTNVSANTPIALNEAGLDGYTFTSLTGDEGCPEALGGTVTLKEGEEISCTITNTRDTGNIQIAKLIDIDGDLATTEDRTPYEGWVMDVDPDGQDTSDPSLPVTDVLGQTSANGIKTGIYWISEENKPGYDVMQGSCTLNGQPTGNGGIVDSFGGVEVAKDTTTYCTFINTPNGTIHGYKWEDLNGNRERDCKNIEEDGGEFRSNICEKESLLDNWTINLYQSNGEGGFGSEPIRTMVTDSGSEHFGWYWFEHLLPGQYKVCEVLEDSWTQTYPNGDGGNCHIVNLPDGNSNEFNESRNYVYGPEYNFGNQFIAPELTILKYNSQWPTVQSPGSVIDYTIEVEALENDVNGVVVTDLPPEGFKYLSGSWSASSSLGGGHIGNLKLDHIYASPGVWDLGDMKAGEVVTLSYKAQIDGAQQPGLYNDLAWADGTDDRSARVLAAS